MRIGDYPTAKGLQAIDSDVWDRGGIVGTSDRVLRFQTSAPPTRSKLSTRPKLAWSNDARRAALRVRHLEQINLCHCTRDVEQGIDSAEAFQNLVDDGFCRLWFAQIESENNRLRSNRPHFDCSVFQNLFIPRH